MTVGRAAWLGLLVFLVGFGTTLPVHASCPQDISDCSAKLKDAIPGVGDQQGTTITLTAGGQTVRVSIDTEEAPGVASVANLKAGASGRVTYSLYSATQNASAVMVYLDLSGARGVSFTAESHHGYEYDPARHGTLQGDFPFEVTKGRADVSVPVTFTVQEADGSTHSMAGVLTAPRASVAGGVSGVLVPGLIGLAIGAVLVFFLMRRKG